MKKKVILIQAAQMEGEKVRKVEKSYIVSRTMPYLAALFSEYSHEEWEVVLIDDYLKGERIIDKTADLYAITAMAATLGRAIQIGEILKSQNPKTPVIIGGPGPTASLDEIKDLVCFDSIFVGEAEMTLRQFLEDFERGTIKKIYCSDRGLLQELEI
ncbi:cobalamin B12-binding domain-containing protein, partial [bacterium]|nr:cobalamin B12-binding domain-containing protein [bacterium]